MIAVLADDLSGAAEIAAIGWRFGLKARVSTAFDPGADADLLVVDTDARSATRTVAKARTAELSHALSSPLVQWTYKKVDSVLRGHVVMELETMMQALGLDRAMLAPANPSKGRVITQGRYLVDGMPLDQTDFGHDPQWPARSCKAADLLTPSRGCPVHVLRHAAYSAEETGIVLAEAETLGDLAAWAARLDEQTLAAGGADFFTAILERRRPSRRAARKGAPAPLAGPKAFVCGSSSQASRKAVAVASRAGIPVCPMPGALFMGGPGSEALMARWAEDMVSALRSRGRAMACIDGPAEPSARLALDLRTHMAGLVQQLLAQTRVKELLIEGGATARAIMEAMGWDMLVVTGEHAPGVVRLRVHAPQGQMVTLKPGTYPWPAGLLACGQNQEARGKR